MAHTETDAAGVVRERERQRGTSLAEGHISTLRAPGALCKFSSVAGCRNVRYLDDDTLTSQFTHAFCYHFVPDT